MKDRAVLIYYAGVMLREARARRGTPFAHFLLGCASKARREAMATPAAARQLDMFGAGV